MEADFKKQIRADVLKAFGEAEKISKPALSEMFTDVYGSDEKPWNLREQEAELKKLMELYPEEYSTLGYKE